ncbi:MAG: hypothetical protein KJ737_08370 [Proteobacteria bacterium]|nr:hypothetical protein [Pseudomonadota bacterium]
MKASKAVFSILLFLAFGGVMVFTGCDLGGVVSSTLPTITLNTTAGQVIVGDSVVITGKVTKGTNDLKDLVVLNDNEQKIADVPFASDGSFSYEFTMGDGILSTCNFRVRDVNYLSNRERISFIHGSSEANKGYPAQYDTVEEAANILINEDFLNNILQVAIDVVNNELPDAIDQVIPYTQTTSLNMLYVRGVTTTIHDLNIGKMSLGPILLQDDEKIIATDVSMEGVSIDGELDIHAWLFGSFTVPFRLRGGVQNIVLDQFMMKLLYDEPTNDIVLQFNVDDLDEDFFDQLNINVELVGLPWWLNNIMNWVIDIIKDMVGSVLRAMFDIISIPIMDVNDLAMSLDLADLGIGLPSAEIYGAIWFPTGYIYENNPACSNCGEMYIHSGVALKPVSQNKLNPGLDHFYATPDSGLPSYDELSFRYGNHNLSVGVSDDMVNMTLFAAIQSGMFNKFDVTPIFEAVVKDSLGFQLPKIEVSMKTPPIADWSGPTVTHVASSDEDEVYAGTYLVRNLVIEISDQASSANLIRLSVDVDVAMNMKMSQDGTYIEAFMDRANSNFNIGYLYLLIGDLTVLGNLAEDITLYLMDMIIGSMIKVEIPSADMYGHEITPHVYKAEVGNNNMVLWLGMERS